MTTKFILAEPLIDTKAAENFKAAMAAPGVSGATIRLTFADVCAANGTLDFSLLTKYRALMPSESKMHLGIVPIAGPVSPPYKTVVLDTIGPFGNIGNVAFPCIWDPAFTSFYNNVVAGLEAFLDDNDLLDLLDGFRICNAVTYPGDGEWGFRTSAGGKRYDTEWQAAGYLPQNVLSVMSAHGKLMASRFPGSLFTFAAYSPLHSAVRVNDAGDVVAHPDNGAFDVDVTNTLLDAIVNGENYGCTLAAMDASMETAVSDFVAKTSKLTGALALQLNTSDASVPLTTVKTWIDASEAAGADRLELHVNQAAALAL